MWIGSADRQIVVLDALTGTAICQLGDQGSFVRFVGVSGWKIWTVNNKGIRVFASECLWKEDIEKVARTVFAPFDDHQVGAENGLFLQAVCIRTS